MSPIPLTYYRIHLWKLEWERRLIHLARFPLSAGDNFS